MALEHTPRLRQVMEERDISQRALSDRSGISQGTIWRACNGKSIQPGTLLRLAGALSVPEGVLTGATPINDVGGVVAGNAYEYPEGQGGVPEETIGTGSAPTSGPAAVPLIGPADITLTIRLGPVWTRLLEHVAASLE